MQFSPPLFLCQTLELDVHKDLSFQELKEYIHTKLLKMPRYVGDHLQVAYNHQSFLAINF